MNQKKLRTAEQHFLTQYPGGFQHPDMQVLAKKHKMSKLVEFAQTSFHLHAFNDTQTIIDNAIKLVGRSSMVSVFEKPKFRDYVRSLDSDGRQRFINSLQAQLHGESTMGFEDMVTLLGEAKLAKWPLVTIIPFYFRPNTEVFVKPTTCKGVITTFELDDITYHARPTYAFYVQYCAHIMAMKAALGSDVAPDNAAFCGFLMMSMNA
jgi:hypothetical protein